MRDIADFLGHRGLSAVSIYAKYDPRLLRQVASFSLARVQMAFWTLLVLPAFVYIYCTMGRLDSLNKSVLALIGISAATGLGAMAISFYIVLVLSGANDVLAHKFNVSLNALVGAASSCTTA